MLRLYDDRTKRLEPFLPRGGEVTLYVCGITPYDTTHLGHAFTYCSFDVLVRYLEWLGLGVRYVQNVTDVDDDILRRAREVGEDWLALGNRWVRRFIDDMEALNVRPPDAYPRASGAAEQIVEVIGALVAKGDAYARGGSVYFRSARAPFGCLSRLPSEEHLQVAAERGNVAEDVNKEAPLDFPLWQAQRPGEPAWPSPWGPGRPGWHVECTTLARAYLGPLVDIHGGGADLSFPHHECEIALAQAWAAEGPLARYWLHSGMVWHLGAKMSKSLGNLVMVCKLAEDYAPDAIRLLLAGHHYREPWAYDAAELEQAAAMARRWREAASPSAAPAAPGAREACLSEFRAAMDDDLDTPRAVGALDRLAHALRHPTPGGDGPAARASLRELAGILGLRLGEPGPEARVTAGWERHKTGFPVAEAAPERMP